MFLSLSYLLMWRSLALYREAGLLCVCVVCMHSMVRHTLLWIDIHSPCFHTTNVSTSDGISKLLSDLTHKQSCCDITCGLHHHTCECTSMHQHAVLLTKDLQICTHLTSVENVTFCLYFFLMVTQKLVTIVCEC